MSTGERANRQCGPARRRLLALGLAAWAAPARPAGRGADNNVGNSTDTPTASNTSPTDDDLIQAGRALRFPRDHGAHTGARIEWWYATGWLQGAGGRLLGFQLTFFRSRTGLALALPGRFAPRQLLFAHAAISDIQAGTHHHAQRISRWSGDDLLPEAHARRADTGLVLGRWTLQRESAPKAAALRRPPPQGRGETLGAARRLFLMSAATGQGGQTGQPEAGAANPAVLDRYWAQVAAPEAGFTLALQLLATQPLLLQGEAGFSRKGPTPQQASHYYSMPQMAVRAQLSLAGKDQALSGRGWLDHEWSDQLLAGGAVGWDWIGINLSDGGALTAFVLRGAAGRVLWAGGSHRPAPGSANRQATVRNFAPEEVVFSPLREWLSPASGARYPVQWRVQTPAGTFELRALLDNQELDSRASTGAVYWEGLAELLAPGGARAGLGYLEMTGRAQPLKLGV